MLQHDIKTPCKSLQSIWCCVVSLLAPCVWAELFGVTKPMKSTSTSTIEQLGISKTSLAARGLRKFQEVEGLEIAEIGDDGKEHLLVPAASYAWQKLKNAAREDQVLLFIASGFRSIERQEEIIRRKLNNGACIEDIMKVCAPPGYSEHHTGCAVDIATPGSPILEAAFEKTPAFRWLEIHANSFGFYLSFPKGNTCGYQYEPWHWCFDSVQPLISVESP